MIYLSLLAVIVLHVALFSRRGLLDPVSVFFLAFLYYSYLTPIVMLNFDIFSVDFAGAASWVTADTINKAAILFLVGYTGFSSAYFLFTGGSKGSQFESPNLKLDELLKDRYLLSIIAFAVLIIAILTTVFRDALLASTESYEGKISGNYSNSSYAFLLSVALTAFSLIVNYIVLNSRRFLLAAAVGVVLCLLLTILTFSKYPLIFAALCTFCALHRMKWLPFPVLITGLIIGSVLMTVLFLPMFSEFRATGRLEFSGFSARSVNLMIAEASSPFSIVHLGFSGYIRPEGHPLWHSFALWIPRAIWPDRPLDIAEGFAQQVIVNWQAGFGLGFSPFAEAYARVGLYGSFFFMAMVGAIMALLQRGFAALVPPEMRIPATLTIGGIVSVLVLRGAFSGLITQSLQNWVPIVLMSLIASQVVRFTGGQRPFAGGMPASGPGLSARHG
jgi:oligosaccharide repeat unit polymerase